MRGGGKERERNSEILRERERERDWKFEREREKDKRLQLRESYKEGFLYYSVSAAVLAALVRLHHPLL